MKSNKIIAAILLCVLVALGSFTFSASKHTKSKDFAPKASPLRGLNGFTESKAFPLQGLGGYSDSLLCRSWKVDWQATYNAMSSENQQRFLAMDTEQQERIQNTISSQVYSFSLEGTLSIDWQSNGVARHQDLTWQREGMIITMTLNGQVREAEIKSLTSSTLLLETLNMPSLFSVLHFLPND